MMTLRKYNPLMKILNNSLVDLPTPMNISVWWNFGSLLSLCLIIQTITGLFLAMHYSSDVLISFNSVIYITREVDYGWMLRTTHANGASMFFITMYSHVGRGMYFASYNLMKTWFIGIIILFMIMATAFVGYVLPWGQMSFWGATVITNLLSAIPYLGEMLVNWVWGGFAIDNATLTRFFSAHFILPFIVMALVMVHLLFLHQTGSNNPIGMNSNIDKISFHPFFSSKDLVGFIVILTLLVLLTLITPNMLNDVENFTPANPLVTPTHIQPEWYFLFAYAILRSIPNKLGGVVALFISIAIITIMPLKNNMLNSSVFSPINKFLMWTFMSLILLLTWIGACPVESPYTNMGQALTMLYFFYYFLDFYMSKLWNKIIF